jgi:hypothetical protein
VLLVRPLDLRPSCVPEKVGVNKKWHSVKKMTELEGVSAVGRSQLKGVK